MSFDSKIFWKQTKQANRAVNAAAAELRTSAGQSLQSYTSGDSFALLASLRTLTKGSEGEIHTIKLGMLRYGIIQEYGAGRSVPTALVGRGNSRRPAPWISEPFERIAPKLANCLAKIKGDDMVELVDDDFRQRLGTQVYRITD